MTVGRCPAVCLLDTVELSGILGVTWQRQEDANRLNPVITTPMLTSRSCPVSVHPAPSRLCCPLSSQLRDKQMG